jgi:hypothetical protein
MKYVVEVENMEVGSMRNQPGEVGVDEVVVALKIRTGY